jgi:hypothetical protein
MKDFLLRHNKMIHLPIESKTACIFGDMHKYNVLTLVQRAKLTKISCPGVFF